MNKGGRMSTSPPLPQLLPEVPSSRPGSLTPASSFSTPSLAPFGPGPEDDHILGMPVLQPHESYQYPSTYEAPLNCSEASREIYCDNVIENLVESYRRRESKTPTPSIIKPTPSSSAKKPVTPADIPQPLPSVADSKDDSLEDVYADWPRPLKMEEESEFQPQDFKISDDSAVRCALSIPEQFVPTPHQDFIKDLGSRKAMKKKKLLDSPVVSRNPTGQAGDVKTKSESAPAPAGSLNIKKQTEMKLRSAFAKYKKWDEAERSKLEKLGDNKILVNGTTVIEIDYSDYLKEEDVVMELDEDWKTCPMPPLPSPTAPNCQAPSCRLGCICNDQKPVARTHCGKPKCFFECTCQQTVFSNGDDGDIRSRLRPRVSLLNWRYLESAAEREKDPPVNYRQLERGAAIYPRMRRVAVTPQRFRNEYIMSHKYKDTFGRERRSSVPGLKFIRNQQVVKRDTRTNIYRRGFAGRPKVGRPKGSLPIKPVTCKPCTVSIDPLSSTAIKKTVPVLYEKTLPLEQKLPDVGNHLKVPPLVQAIIEDGQILLMGTESMCFFAWTIHSRHPQAAIYQSIKGDALPIPWLYVPIPSADDTWIFHQLSPSLQNCIYVYIPEINCVIPSKALLMNINLAEAKKKGVSLKILWIGQDSKTRMGNIYIFPQIPGVIVCGPFPKSLVKMGQSRKVPNALNLCRYVDKITQTRFMGDNHSWNSFFSSNSQRALNAVKENLRKPEETVVMTGKEDDDEEGELIPESLFMKMVPGFLPHPQPLNRMNSKPNQRNPPENLRVSWKDVGRIIRRQVL